MLITAIRLGGLEVKILFYQPMDPGSSPGEGRKNFFFFPKKKNAKIYRRIYAMGYYLFQKSLELILAIKKNLGDKNSGG